MPKRFTDGYFALGLAIGLFSAIILGLFISSGYQPDTQLAYAVDQSPDQTNQCGDRNEPVWGPWFGLCFGLYDSIAQWMMMAFTIVAAGLLYGALIQANKTNLAAIKAATAAGETNQIMRDEGAGYLVIDSVRMQVQGRILLIQAHVRNIGQRPVRRGKVKGRVTFRWPSMGDNGVPEFHSAIARFDVWIGVVEAGRAARGLDGISFSEFFEYPNKFDAHIVGNKDVDVDCKITWVDSLQAASGERHILSKSGSESVLSIDKGDIIELKVGYSGMPKHWEEHGED